MNYHSFGVSFDSPDINGLFAGSYPVVDLKVRLVGGTDLPAGSVLGQVTASGDYRLSDLTATDGSEVPAAILSHPVTAEDDEAIAFFTGWYRGDSLTFGGGHTVDSTRKALRGLNIHIS